MKRESESATITLKLHPEKQLQAIRDYIAYCKKEQRLICKHCNGSGRVKYNGHFFECPVCKGEGKI